MLFSVGKEYWLKGTESRANMRVVVVDNKLDANGDWTYQLEDSNGQLIEGGKYLPEDDLSNNAD
jgi:hypothetical protein